jgi:hypothetical protein
MEIGPITGLRTLPIKAPSKGLALPAVFDIENYAQIHNESHSSNSERAGSGMADDFEDIDEFDEIYECEEEDNEAALSVYAPKKESAHHLLSFFA